MLLVADTVDYCRLVTRRVDVADVRLTVEGDEAIASAMLDVARSVAV